MFRYSVKLIYRSFKRYKTSFFINLVGLSSGLACALLIFLWVNHELRMDKFHENDERLYQIMEHVDQSEGIVTRQTTSGPMAEALADEIPEVEYAVVTTYLSSYTLSVDNTDITADGLYASANFFKLFSYELTQGNKNQVLSDKKSIVISESLAVSLFGTSENATGKTVEWQKNKQYQVSGVFKNIPHTSSLRPDFLLTFEGYRGDNEFVTNWVNTMPRTYVLLKKNADIGQFNNKIADFVKTKTNSEIIHRTPFATLYSDRYLYNQYENGAQAGGRIEYVRLFSIIALFILLIACINFMNLSTAKASRRLKEVGIKKAVGAGRSALVFQYLGESTLMATLSLVVAIGLVLLLLPQFNEVTGKQLYLPFDASLILSFLSITLITGLMAGSYPALYLSASNPVKVLKGKLNKSVGELWARKGLVVLQFTLSIILIASVWVIYQQIAFVQTQNLGYEQDNIILFKKEGLLQEEGKLETFLKELKNIPGVVNASSSLHDMTGHHYGTGMVWPGKGPNDKTEFEQVVVNYGLIETFGIEMQAGRTFSKDFGADDAKIIFNETAIDLMGLTDPIGKIVELNGDDKEIIGVAKDFHFDSFREEIKPLFFHLAPGVTNKIVVKIETGSEQEVINSLQQFYQIFNPGYALNYWFLNEDYQALYAAEQRVATLSKYFAGIAILISCLGLFGLAAFTAERRQKEIGIRKVMGASISSVTALLSRDFIRLVLIAVLIATPFAWYAMSRWLEDFAYRIELHWWMFALAGLLAVVIALLTVSFQSVKAALMNPVKSLRSD